jgi:hypothetical protein
LGLPTLTKTSGVLLPLINESTGRNPEGLRTGALLNALKASNAFLDPLNLLFGELFEELFIIYIILLKNNLTKLNYKN